MPTGSSRVASALLVAGIATVASDAHADGRNAAETPHTVDYTLKASLDPAAHTITGTGTIHFVNTSTANIYELWVHLYLNAFKNASSRFMREPVGPFRGGGGIRTWGMIDVTRFAVHHLNLWPKAETHLGSDEDETDARVPLAGPLAPGVAIDIDLAWTSKLPSVVERTGFEGSYHFAGQWFPKIAKLEPNGAFSHFAFTHLTEFYADYGSYDVTIDVPQGFLIGATGPLIASSDEGGRHIERRVQSDIHDFAFTAWDGFDKSESKIGSVAVTMLAPRGMQSTADRELASIAFALPYFSQKYGEYPYPVLTVVHPPDNARETGGMEYPTLITTGGPFYLPRAIRVGEEVTIHELGHQWFYGLVGSNENKFPFLDEGLNSYAEEDAMERAYGAGSVFEGLDLSLSDLAVQAVSSRFAVHDDRVNTPADSFATGFDYGRLVYGRTATIFETMRRTWGDDKMELALGSYTRDFRFAHPTPTDLLREVSDHIGEDASRFAKTALDEKGWVDFVALAAQSEIVGEAPGVYDHAGKPRETVPTGRTTPGKYQGTVLVGRRGTLVLPVDVELVDSAGGKRRVRWDGHDEHFRIQYQGDAPLAFAVIDPDHAVLVDDNFLNNHIAVSSANKPGAPRTLERAFFWAETLMQGAMP